MEQHEKWVPELEINLVEIKAEVKELLDELESLMAQGRNPLADQSIQQHSSSHPSPIMVVAPSTVL